MQTTWFRLVIGRAAVALIALSGWTYAGTALAADLPGSADHPLVGRYAGSSIVEYRQADFDEAALLQAPHDFGAVVDSGNYDDRSGPEWLKVEGRVTRIRYAIPPGRSSLEVLRNYQQSLAAKGFTTVLFDCADQACLKGLTRDPYAVGWQVDTLTSKPMNYFDHARWHLVKMDRPEGAVYAGVLAGERSGEATAYVIVVETKATAADRIVFLDASQLGQALDRDGHVAVYGIQFDFDSAQLKPESMPTLDEIAKLLRAQPDLRIELVGHTDNAGTAEYNRSLSLRRAQSVSVVLSSRFGVAPDRLKASGKGDTQPVADNSTDAGRAKNRRVELVTLK